MKNKIYLIIFLFLIVEFLEFPGAYAQIIPQNTAVRIIVGEAANQGIRGMICVAEVLRRRGSIKGFYGYPSNRRPQPKLVWEMAEKAWQLSLRTHYTNGADHFENVHRFGLPWWAKYCVKTYEYKDHVFFKEIRI